MAAIRFAHRYADAPNPIEASCVQLALRRAARAKPRRPAQAEGLTVEALEAILAACPATLAGLRDAALISVGYDTLCRGGELAAVRVDHLRIDGAGVWSLLIPRAKGDQSGDGRIAYLSPRSVARLARWRDAAGICFGPLFRALHLGRASPDPLDTGSISRLVKRAARRAGLGDAAARAFSGHSMRVGAAQDMLVAGFDTLAIMQAGGWKTPHVLLRYVENARPHALHERRWKALGARVEG